MGLTKAYPLSFERLWSAYPKWPTGRSKKELAFKAFEKLKLSETEVEELVLMIEQMKRDRATWQPSYKSRDGRVIGPQGLQVFLTQRAWQDDYLKFKETRPKVAEEKHTPPWEQRGMTEEAWRAHCDAERDKAMAQLREARLLH